MSWRDKLAADPELVHRRFPELDFGTTGARALTLRGATLLHVAAEYGSLEAATLLLGRGADVNARATIDPAGVGGQTAIFHAATQFGDVGLPLVRLLLDRGADLSVRVRLPGHYEQAGRGGGMHAPGIRPAVSGRRGENGGTAPASEGAVE